jgi:hypothetical protein
VDLAAVRGLSVSTLNTIVSKTDESYSRCGPSLSTESKSLKTSLLEELESFLSAWFKQARTANASIDSPHLKEEALHVDARLGFRALDGWIDRFKKIHNVVYKTMLGESDIVNPETVMDWKIEELTKIIDGYQPKGMFNADETGLFYNLQPSKTLTQKCGSCQGGTLLLGCNTDGTKKLPPLVSGKYNKSHCLKIKSTPNTQQIPIHGRLQPLLRSSLCNRIAR